LALLFAGLLLVWFLFFRPAPPSSYLLIDGLYGPVKQVVIENAVVVQQFDDWVETARATESATLYSASGQITDIRRYQPGTNKLDYHIIYRYDGEQLLEEASFDPRGEPLYKWFYSYEDGQLESLTGYRGSGDLDFRTVFSYDDQARLIEETAYNDDFSLQYAAEQSYTSSGYTRTTTYYLPDNEVDYLTIETFSTTGLRLEEKGTTLEGAPQYRVTYRYTETGELLEEAAFQAEDVQQYRLENAYDPKGNLIEATEFDADNEPFFRYGYDYDERNNITLRSTAPLGAEPGLQRYEYNYDAQGNWVERKTFKQVERFGEQLMQPVEVSYRMITYYQD